MKRFDQLQKILERCLSESSKCIDTKVAVEKCYGDDVSMFATNDDGINMLENLVRDILDRINESFVQDELPKILSEEQVELKLNILDQVIQEYRVDQKEKEDKEQRDIQSARDAVENSQFLPQGMNISHILAYQSYQMKTMMKQELSIEVERIEAERAALLEKICRTQENVKGVVSGIERNIVEPLNTNVDICSFNGIS